MARHNVSIKDKLSIAPTFFSQMFYEYRDKVTSKISNNTINRPWMRFREIGILKEVLKHLKPRMCLEWGAGNSTVYFPEFLNEDARWISIEHEKDWASKIRSMNLNSNVEIFHVAPDNFPWSDEHEDGAYSDLLNYITFPEQFGKFDFILVDGRARSACLIKAHELIKKEGVVILHDANREYYHEPFGSYEYQIMFKDWRVDDGGLWLGSRGIDIARVLSVDTHKGVWQIYNKFGSKLSI